jgi:hypothetical protein
MKENFDTTIYGRRSQAETVVSMIKRRQGKATKSCSFHARCRDLRLMALTHNIMILRPMRAFLQSHSRPVCSSVPFAHLLNAPETEAQLEALRRSVRRGCPFGRRLRSEQTVRRLGLGMTVRLQGRPKKQRNES